MDIILLYLAKLMDKRSTSQTSAFHLTVLENVTWQTFLMQGGVELNLNSDLLLKVVKCVYRHNMMKFIQL